MIDYTVLMKEFELFGHLLPSHPDIFPILQKVREKYQIPEIRPEDDGFIETLLTEYEIDWHEVRQEIEQELKASDAWIPEGIRKIYKGAKTYDDDLLDFPELAPLPEETRNQVIAAMKILYRLSVQAVPSIDAFYKATADLLFEYLITGRAREAPQDWFGKVFTMPSFEFPSVVAMAIAYYTKVIAEQFKAEFIKTFGRDRPRIRKLSTDCRIFIYEVTRQFSKIFGRNIQRQTPYRVSQKPRFKSLSQGRSET